MCLTSAWVNKGPTAVTVVGSTTLDALGPWWQLLLQLAPDEPAVEGFDLSLEVTHHGPTVGVPSMFIEVGSTEATWGHEGAARLLASIIRRGLMDGHGEWDAEQNKGELVLRPSVVVIMHLVQISWRRSTACGWVTCWQPTRCRSRKQRMVGWRVPGDSPFVRLGRDSAGVSRRVPIVCSMDKKAFKGWQRQAVRDLLEIEGVPLLTTNQIKERLAVE